MRQLSSQVSAPNAALSQNIAGQPDQAISPPPSDGPSVEPTADKLPNQPMARPARPAGAQSLTPAMLSAIMHAAPSPCSARAAISIGKLGAAAHSAEPTLNTAMPAKSKRRRPRLSLKRPTLTLSAVRVSR